MSDCQGTGRIVSAALSKTAIYTGARGWIAYCRYCERSAPFALAEVKKDSSGYVRRFLSHPAAEAN